MKDLLKICFHPDYTGGLSLDSVTSYGYTIWKNTLNSISCRMNTYYNSNNDVITHHIIYVKSSKLTNMRFV